MVIDLPDLSRRECLYLSVCGSVVDPPSDVSKWLRIRRVLISSFRKKGRTYLVRLITGGDKINHFHIEIASPSVFLKPPKRTTNITELKNYFSKVAGLGLNVSGRADFKSKVSDFPEKGVIRLFSVENKMGDVSMRMTSGTISLTGSPVRRITWKLSAEKDEALVFVEADKISSVSTFYVTEFFEWVHGLYELFVFGRGSTAV